MEKQVNFKTMLKIICATSIPEFVPIIRTWTDKVLRNAYELKFEAGEAPSGRNVRQKYTDIWAGDNAYVMFHDHDNLISTEIAHWLLWNIPQVGSAGMAPSILMFDQIWFASGPQRLIAKPENCVPCKCDISQLVVHASFLKGMVWTDRYENDGDFISELYRRYPEHFVFVNGVNAWYNALCPGKGKYNGEIKLIA